MVHVSGELPVHNKAHYRLSIVSHEPVKGAHSSLLCGILTRFCSRDRWINEMLYKSDSKKAVKMMHEDPSMFQEVRSPFPHLRKQ